METAITTYDASLVQNELSANDVALQARRVQEIMQALMKEGEHYGVIPGTQNPTLYKAGAEKLGFAFRLVPQFEVTRHDMPGGHREYEVKCTLIHGPSGIVAGEGVGTCSTMESKYRYRNAARKCPNCGKESIIKGKREYGGGWICFKKKGGCGMKFEDHDKAITGQQAGKVENEDVADVWNTILKMSKKRAHVDAIITATAASDIFAQDLEDLPHFPEPRRPEPEPERWTEEEAREKLTALRNWMDDNCPNGETACLRQARANVSRWPEEWQDDGLDTIAEYQDPEPVNEPAALHGAEPALMDPITHQVETN